MVIVLGDVQELVHAQRQVVGFQISLLNCPEVAAGYVAGIEIVCFEQIFQDFVVQAVRVFGCFNAAVAVVDTIKQRADRRPFVARIGRSGYMGAFVPE